MKRSNWPVQDHGIRPAGSADKCFYCGQQKGDEHSHGCVIRTRTVVVRFSIEVVLQEPEDFAASMIEFRHNESSWCADNLIYELEEMRDRLAPSCLCEFVMADYVREATEEDEKRHNRRIADAKS